MGIDIIEQLKQDIENTSNYEEIFEIYSEKLINNYALKFENKIYNFVEIEFYFYDKEKHPDPYVHMDEDQLESHKFYPHGSGIDLSFGNGRFYGGILIRSIKEEDEYINGSLTLMEKIFSKSKITREDTNKLKLIELDNSTNLMVYSSTRVGLQPHPLDYEFFTESKEIFKPFIFRLYRFVSNIDLSKNKCKDKTKIIFHNYKKNIDGFKRPKYIQDTRKES